MKIALVTDGIFPYVIGGMQKHSFYLAKYLAQAGVEVDLYHTNQSVRNISLLEVFTEEEKRNIRSVVIDFPASGKLPGHYLRTSYKYSCLLYEAFLKNAPVDLIYAKGFSGWKFAEERSKKNLKIPLGINFHGYEMFQQAPSFKNYLEQVLLFKGPVKYIVKRADLLFSYGGKITKIIKGLGVSDERIIEIPAGIEETWLSDKITFPNEKRRFVFVGRFERRKGIEELKNVLRSLSSSNEFQFTFVGPIPDKLKLHSENIKYEGAVSDPEKLKAILDRHDILVCPSHSEGMPNVILEAMARGLAVIATDVGAVAEMVSQKNGFLIAPGNETELKEAMLASLNLDADALTKMKKNSLEMVRNNFLWSQISVKTISSIQEALKRAASL